MTRRSGGTCPSSKPSLRAVRGSTYRLMRCWASLTYPGLDVPKEEARFLIKLDLTLCSAAALGVMIRYLDQ
jgi:hypothetical protein